MTETATLGCVLMHGFGNLPGGIPGHAAVDEVVFGVLRKVFAAVPVIAGICYGLLRFRVEGCCGNGD